MPVGDNYFTTAQPPNCEAAVLFENSPLRRPGASEHAESAYHFAGPATYGESIDIYGDPLDVRHVVVDGFIAIAQCRGDAFGVTRTESHRRCTSATSIRRRTPPWCGP